MRHQPVGNLKTPYQIGRALGISEIEATAQLHNREIEPDVTRVGNGYEGLWYPEWAIEVLQTNAIEIISAPKTWKTISELAKRSRRSHLTTRERLTLFAIRGRYMCDRGGRIRLHYRLKETDCLRLLTVSEIARQLGTRARWVRVWMRKLSLRPVACQSIKSTVAEFYEPAIVAQLSQLLRCEPASRGMKTVFRLAFDLHRGERTLTQAFEALGIKGEYRLASNGSNRVHFTPAEIEQLQTYLESQ